MIIHGDSVEELKNIPDNSIDLIITSPPYAERRKKTYGGIPAHKYTEWFKPIAIEIKRILKPSGSFFLNIKTNVIDGERSLYVFKLIIMLREELGFYFIEEYCWTKNAFPTGTYGRFKNGFEPIYHLTKSKAKHIIFNPLACGTKVSEETIARAFRKNCKTPNNGSGMVVDRNSFKSIELARPSNIINANNSLNQFSKNKSHSAVFPEKLVSFFIKSFSDESNIVLDPFAGSGTVGKVCKELNRKFILIDKELENIKLMNKLIK